MSGRGTLLVVGSSFPYSEFLPREGQARGIQIDLDGRMLGIRYPMELNLVGDSARRCARSPRCCSGWRTAWRAQIEQDVEDWWKMPEARAMNEANPINPQRVFHELSPRLPDLAIIAADSGSGANWYARDLKIRSGMMASLSGTLATMGAAVPYAIAAKFCHPSRFVLAIADDGAMQMNGINGLITIPKYWRDWSDPRLVVLVLNNRDLNQVTWEQRALAGDTTFAATQQIPDFPYARYTESLGLMGLRVDQPAQIAAAIDRFIDADRPTLLEAIVDPDVPPLPPHISLEQA